MLSVANLDFNFQLKRQIVKKIGEFQKRIQNDPKKNSAIILWKPHFEVIKLKKTFKIFYHSVRLRAAPAARTALTSGSHGILGGTKESQGKIP